MYRKTNITKDFVMVPTLLDRYGATSVNNKKLQFAN